MASEFFIRVMEVLVSIMGIVMSLGYFSQAWIVFRNKSSEDVSLLTFLILSLGTLTWFVYGFLIWDVPIMLGFGVGVFGSWSVLILSIYYR